VPSVTKLPKKQHIRTDAIYDKWKQPWSGRPPSHCSQPTDPQEILDPENLILHMKSRDNCPSFQAVLNAGHFSAVTIGYQLEQQPRHTEIVEWRYRLHFLTPHRNWFSQLHFPCQLSISCIHNQKKHFPSVTVNHGLRPPWSSIPTWPWPTTSVWW